MVLCHALLTGDSIDKILDIITGWGGGVLLLFSDALELYPFGVGAYRLLVTISGL